MVSSIIAWFKKTTQHWLVKRIPAQSKVTLNRRNIFIMPTRFGACYGICCLLLFMLGTNYQNNLIILFSMLLSSIFMTTMLMSYQNLAGVSVQRLPIGECFAHQSLKIPCQVMAEKSRYAISFELKQQQVMVEQFIDQANVEIIVLPLPRGEHRLARITVASIFPFGLYRAWSHLDLAIDVLVFPEPLVTETSLISQQDDSRDCAMTIVGAGDNFAGLSEYRPGESLKRVAWKQMAQGRGMLTKQFEQGFSAPHWLDYDRVGEGSVEQKLSYLCYLVLEMSKLNQPFGLILPNQTLAVGHGESHRRQVLSMLACYGETDGQSVNE